MGFSAVAAVIEGTATAATVAAAVGEVGLAMSVVGAVTGSKDLMKIGGVMGLAGGVGSLAMSAGDTAAGVGAGLTGDAVPTTGSMTQAGDYGMNAAADASNAGSAVASSVSDPLSGLTQSSLPDMTNPDDAIDMASNAGYPSLGGSPYNVDPLGTGQPTTSGASASGTGASGPTMSTGTSTAAVNPTAGATDPATSTALDSANQGQNEALKLARQNDIAPVPTQGFWSGMLDWAKNNKELANGAAKLGAGALQGMGTAYDANRKYQLGVDQLALQQQAARNANSLPTINNMGVIAGARG